MKSKFPVNRMLSICFCGALVFIGACLCYGATSFWKPSSSLFLSFSYYCGNRPWKEAEFSEGGKCQERTSIPKSRHGKQHFSYLLQWPSDNGHHQLNHLKKGTNFWDSFIPDSLRVTEDGKNNAKATTRVKGVRKARTTTDDSRG